MSDIKSGKKVFIRQPVYLPGLVFIDQLLQVDTYVIYDNVQYERRHFGNRNKIRNLSGWQWLTVPILQKGKREQWYHDTLIDNKRDWARDHWQSLFFNYAKAPYFNKYADFFRHLYQKKWGRLDDLDLKIIYFVKDQLNIKTEIVLASELKTKTDFANKTERLTNIIEEVGGKVYITGKGTYNYLDQKCMKKHGITLLWHQFEHPTYVQFHGGEFIPNMSVVDLLFNYGDRSGEILRKNKQTPLTKYKP